MSSREDAGKEEFELVTVLEKPMLFSMGRLDRNTVPKGMYLYEVRHDDAGQGIPMEIAEHILVNHWGTLLSNAPIRLARMPGESRPCRMLCEEDWNYEGITMKLDEFRKQFPPRAKPQPSYER